MNTYIYLNHYVKVRNLLTERDGAAPPMLPQHLLHSCSYGTSVFLRETVLTRALRPEAEGHEAENVFDKTNTILKSSSSSPSSPRFLMQETTRKSHPVLCALFCL